MLRSRYVLSLCFLVAGTPDSYRDEPVAASGGYEPNEPYVFSGIIVV